MLRTAGTARPVRRNGPENRRLTKALLCPEMLEALAREKRRSGQRVRLRLAIPGDERHASLRAVPWELCALGTWTESGFTGMPLRPLTMHPDVQVVRSVRTTRTFADGSAALVGRILLASAYTVSGSLGRHRFRALEQFGMSDTDLAEGTLDGTVLRPERVTPGPGRQSVSAYDLRQAISAGPVAGFYFAGHGAGGLVVSAEGADGDSSPELLTAESLAGQLVAAGTQIAILMACDTAEPSPERPDQIAAHCAFAEGLASAGVPWVVSAHGAITNGASQAFAPAFLAWLASGAAVDEAAQWGAGAMGDGAGLIVVHCAAGLSELSASPVTTSGPPVLARISNAAGSLGRLVNPEVRWGLNRGPIRGILSVGEYKPDLVARLNRAEEIVRQGTFDFDSERPYRRRGWFLVEASRHPLTSAGESELDRLIDQPSWRRYLDGAPDHGHVGVVVAWDPQSPADVIGHVTAFSTFLPGAAIVVRSSGPADADHALMLQSEMARVGPGAIDFLVIPASGADERLDKILYKGGREALTKAATTEEYADDPDTPALAALRHLHRVGQATAVSLLERGVSTEVRAVFAYLARRDSRKRTELTFMCESEPPVVEAAWRAGIRPEFVPARLPPGAVRMPGCWALLAISRLTPGLVRWLYERGPTLASVIGLLPETAADHGHEASLAQVRDAYGLYPVGG